MWLETEDHHVVVEVAVTESQAQSNKEMAVEWREEEVNTVLNPELDCLLF